MALAAAKSEFQIMERWASARLRGAEYRRNATGDKVCAGGRQE